MLEFYMEARSDTTAGRARRALYCAGISAAAAILMTWPLAANLTGLGRSSAGGDGLHSVWNIGWVSRTLVADPGRLFDANIFYPHRQTLAYSEANIVAGVMGVPAWLLTRSAYAAHNTAVLGAFATAFLGMWLLATRLSGDSRAGAVAGLLFAFCPFMFSHTPHIQLLMSGGMPLSMLMLHRVADAPSVKRGAALGVALAVQALSCAYYGIFAGLMVGYAVLFFAAARGLWRSRTYWIAVAVGAAVSMASVLPFFLPYVGLQQDQGFHRTLAESVRYSAVAGSYLASSAHAHAWLLALARQMGGWNGEVLFPGIVAVVSGLAGLVFGLAARDRQTRETALLYGSLGALALWASFGPAAGLYSLLFRLPVFSFLRAPSRFGLLVLFALAVLGAMALGRLFSRLTGRLGTAWAGALVLVAIAELNILPFPWERAIPISRTYDVLEKLPRGTIAEFPFYGERAVFHLHTQYMVFSTSHWLPMVNGYSDHFPDDFRQIAPALASFPSTDTFRLLARYRVRYIGIHWNMFVSKADDVRRRLEPFAPYLRPLAADENMTLYEVVAFP